MCSHFLFYKGHTRDTVHHTVVLNRVSTSVLRHTWQRFMAHQCAAAHRLRTTALIGLSKLALTLLQIQECYITGGGGGG